MHVNRWILGLRPLEYLLAVFEGKYGASEGILEGYEACGAEVNISGC